MDLKMELLRSGMKMGSLSQSRKKWNRPYGKFQCWYENGQIMKEGIMELGIVLEKKEWDQEGHLVKEYLIQPDSDRYKDLLGERALFKQMGYIDTDKEESSLKNDEKDCMNGSTGSD